MQRLIDHEFALETTVQLIEYLRATSPIKVITATRDGSLNITLTDNSIAKFSIEELLSTHLSIADFVSPTPSAMR